MTPEVRAALRRLFAIARQDTGTSGRVARFLLAWWNAGQHGGFDFTDFWSMDPPILADCLLVLKHVAHHQAYYEDELSLYFKDVIAVWGKRKKRAER